MASTAEEVAGEHIDNQEKGGDDEVEHPSTPIEQYDQGLTTYLSW